MKFFKRLFQSRLAANISATETVLPFNWANAFEAVNEEKKTRRTRLCAYGNWPNSKGMQIFTKEDAEAIATDFNNPALNVILPNEHGKMMPSIDPSRMMGLPWFIGHPDHPDFQKEYADKKAYGRIKSLEVMPDGLYGNVRFGSEGERLIADEAFASHSVNWYLLEDKKNPGKYRPYKLKSVGFTNFPNIPTGGVTTANEVIEDELLKRRFCKLTVMRMANIIVTKKPTHYRAMANLRKK